MLSPNSVIAISLRRLICGIVLYLFQVTYDVALTTIALFYNRFKARTVPSMHSVQQSGQSGAHPPLGRGHFGLWAWGRRKQGCQSGSPVHPHLSTSVLFDFASPLHTANSQAFASEFCEGAYPCCRPQHTCRMKSAYRGSSPVTLWSAWKMKSVNSAVSGQSAGRPPNASSFIGTSTGDPSSAASRSMETPPGIRGRLCADRIFRRFVPSGKFSINIFNEFRPWCEVFAFRSFRPTDVLEWFSRTTGSYSTECRTCWRRRCAGVDDDPVYRIRTGTSSSG